MYDNQSDRNDYDIAASQEAQSNFETIAAQLEAALQQRDQDVKATMAAYQAQGVSDEYHSMEQQWNRAGDEVRSIIKTIRDALSQNDEVAQTALANARRAIPT